MSTYYKGRIPVSLPVAVSKEGKWFVAACPLIDIATQGKTEKEVRENIEELIAEYFHDPDTQKPSVGTMMSTSEEFI